MRKDQNNKTKTSNNSSLKSQKKSLNRTTYSANATVDISLTPASVKQLYDVVSGEYSDFAFIYTLSAQLCQDRIPMDCFVILKMSLLLSLASIGVSRRFS